MSRQSRVFGVITVGVLAVFALLATGCGQKPSRPETPEEMAAAVTISRDDWGVPHVSGPTDESVVFGFMYAQAEDNFWQVEDSIIQALGRSAEVNGEAGVPGDLLNRALEVVRWSQEEWSKSDPEIQGLCRAAVAGLNYYLQTHPNIKARLITHFEPWHLMAFSRYAVYQLFVFGRAGIRGDEMGSLAREITPAAVAAKLDLEALPWTPDAAPRGSALQDAQTAAGSNMWAVSPGKTANGHALLFINPHQPYFGPGQWYEGHLRSDEGLHFSGAGFFGSLMPTIGHNEYLGWSHTVNEPDILDVFAETFDDPADPLAYRYGGEHRQATVWTDSVRVKGPEGPIDRQFEFKKTHRGPIVGERAGQALVVKMGMFEEGGQVLQRYRMAKAKSRAEFEDAVATLATPMFNIVYADRDGNIGYVYNGAVPRRDPQFDWRGVVDGSDPRTEWQGYHALGELPQVWNPKSGYVQNCNATPFLASGEGDNPVAEDYPSYMVREQDNPRSRISRRILEGENAWTFAGWQAAAFDTQVIEAEVWIPKLAEAVTALGFRDRGKAAPLKAPLALLTEWNGRSTVESAEMTLFFTWREEMILRRNEDLVDSFAKAIAALEGTWGSWSIEWGEINRLQRIHTSGVGDFSDSEESLPVAGGPGPLGIVFNFYTRPQEGAKRRYGVAGHSFVSTVEFTEQPVAKSILVFGESADKGSPHYFDQARLFAKQQFKPAWFSGEEVEANATRSYHPGEPEADHGAVATAGGAR